MGWNDGAAGDIVMQGVTTGSAAFAANGNGLLANVTWTAPSAGTITVSGRTWDAYGNRPGTWILFVSGTQMAGGNLAANSVRGSAGVTFGANLLSSQARTGIFITAGQEVILNQYGGTAGVEMSVAFTAVPEPLSSVALFRIAVLGGAILRRRRIPRIRRERLSHET